MSDLAIQCCIVLVWPLSMIAYYILCCRGKREVSHHLEP